MGDRGSVQYDKRARRWYVALYWNGKHNKIWKYPVVDLPLTSREMAEELLRGIRFELRQGTFLLKTYLPDSPMAIKGYSEMWLKAIDVCDNTRRVYRSDINICVSYFKNDKDIRKISKADLLKFKKDLGESRKTKGVYNALNTLKTMLRFAYDNDDLKRVPPFPKLSQGQIGKVQFLTYEQQQTVLRAIPERHRPVFEFAMEYGLRVGEVCALHKEDITEDEVIIRRAFSEGKLQGTKTGKERQIGLTEKARSILESSKRVVSWGPYLFSKNSRGNHYSGKSINKIWRNACRESEIDIGVYNAFRHSLGCQLLEEGHSLELVAKALGHSSTAVTRRYAQRTNEAVNQALENRGKVINFEKVKEGE